LAYSRPRTSIEVAAALAAPFGLIRGSGFENAEERKTDHGGGTEHKRGSPARETRRV
jgi:hypothetical protein